MPIFYYFSIYVIFVAFVVIENHRVTEFFYVESSFMFMNHSLMVISSLAVPRPSCFPPWPWCFMLLISISIDLTAFSHDKKILGSISHDQILKVETLSLMSILLMLLFDKKDIWYWVWHGNIYLEWLNLLRWILMVGRWGWICKFIVWTPAGLVFYGV